MTVLILGASRMQIPAISAAHDLGFRVAVADRTSGAPGVALADEFVRVDLADQDGMLHAARRLQSVGGLDGVFTAGTDFSTSVAYVAESLGLPGIPFEVARNASDKARMRGVFSSAGLPSPRFVTLGLNDDPLRLAASLRKPLVVKPVDNMGSRGVIRVDTDEELPNSVKSAISSSRTSRVIVEEFIDGPEFSLDALVYEGEIFVCGIADRHIRFPPYFVEVGHTIPSSQPRGVQEAVELLFVGGIQALRIENGAAKGDIMFSSDGPVIGEIAARLSGGYMSGWTYPQSTGINITLAALNIAVGRHPGALAPTKSYTSAERAFFSIPGIVESVSGFSEHPAPPATNAFLRVSPGDGVKFPRNNVDKCGNTIATAPTREAAISAAESASRSVLVRLRAGTRETEEFLFGGAENWVPDAFALRVESNRRHLAAMAESVAVGDEDSPTDLGITELPDLKAETDYDWHGRSLVESLDFVFLSAGVSVAPARRTLGSRFWGALLRGGIQGALWYVDSIREGQLIF